MTSFNHFFILLLFSIFCFTYPNSSAAAMPSLTPSCYVDGVNVITGEYCEVSTDLLLTGAKKEAIERHYSSAASRDPCDGPSWQFNHPAFCLEEVDEEGKSQTGITYRFDDDHRLSRLEIRGRDEEKIYNALDFSYYSEGEENICEVRSSDGRTLSYSYNYDLLSRGSPQIRINRVVDTLGNEVRYSYRQHPSERKQLIKRVERPGERYLETEYYDGKHNNVGGELVTLDDPIRDYRLGRVKLQKAPVAADGSPVITKKFFYQEGETKVVAANGQKEFYRYDEELQLTVVESYINDELYRAKRFFWDKEKRGRLLGAALIDGENRVRYLQRYSYNDNGLLVEEKHYGNISGRGDEEIAIDSEGLPLSGEVEYALWSYGYESHGEEGNYRLVKKEEPSGKFTLFCYDEKSGQIAATLTGEKGTILLRQFNSYDSEGLLVETVTDDGSGFDREELAGVTERYRARFTLRNSTPALGMPEVIEEYCSSLEHPEEELFRKTLLQYNEQCKVIQREIYGADGTFATSLQQNFDALGRKTTLSDATGRELFWEYDVAGNLVSERAKEGEEEALCKEKLHDRAGRVIKVIESRGDVEEKSSSYHYNKMSQKASETNKHGYSTHYEYDMLGRLISINHPKILSTEGQYDYPKETFSYDIFDNCTEYSDANGYVTVTTYNILGSPTKILYPDGTYEEYEYFIDGTIKSKREKNGTMTLYERDFLGRALREELYSSSHRLLYAITHTYTPFHLVRSIDTRGVETKIEYDSSGKKSRTTTIDRSGIREVEYDYDALGKMRTKKEWFGEGIDDYALFVTEREEGSELVQLKIQDAAGKVLYRQGRGIKGENRRKQPPPLGRKGDLYYREEVTDLSGINTEYTYDSHDRVVSIVKKDSRGTPLADIEMQYDFMGNKVKELHSSCGKQSRGATTLLWKYGPCNRLEAFVEGAGSRKQRTTLYYYNEYGALETIVKPDGVTLTNHYNDEGKISRYFSSDGTIDYEYTYDNFGNVIAVIDRTSDTLTAREYDERGNVTSELLANGHTLSYTYDKFGRLTSYTLPDGSSLHYTFDAANLLQIERKGKKGETLYTHNYSLYDLEGRVLVETIAEDSTEIHYRYDESGNRVALRSAPFSETIEREGSCRTSHSFCDPLGRGENSYLFDEEARIVQESGNACHSYEYDSFGNICSVDERPLSNNASNELEHDGTTLYRYDDNGNLIAKRDGDGEQLFGYDALNRLTSLTLGEREMIAYRYDSQGRRIKKELYTLSEKGEWQKVRMKSYLYIEGNEIGELDEEGNIVSHKIISFQKESDIGAIAAIEIDGKAYGVINDFRGNVACLIDREKGIAAEFYRYSAYGEVEIYDGEAKKIDATEAINPWRTSSKRSDDETGLVYFGKRYYSPQMRRWITLDPLGYIDGINRYCYVRGNPIAYVDHQGLFSFSSLFGDFGSGIDSFLTAAMDLGSKILNYFHSKTHYLRSIENDITGVLEEYFGKGFLTLSGYYSHPLESGVYGQGEISDKVRITLLNGISNIRSYYRDSLELINSTHGGVNIHYIFRPTSGWCRDMLMALLIKCGYVSSYAKELASTWKEMIAEMGGIGGGGTVIHYCHSLGGTDTAIAATLLSPEERAMIKVISIGSATMISSDLGLGDVVNYVSVRDGVCLLDPVGYISALSGKQKNVSFIGSLIGVPFIDHSLAMETYSNMITRLGSVFLHMYAYDSGLL